MQQIKQFFEQDNVKKRFAEMLGKRAHQFIISVLQITASNELLSKADPISIYNSAAVAATLDLPLNNNLALHMPAKDQRQHFLLMLRVLLTLPINGKSLMARILQTSMTVVNIQVQQQKV